MRVLVDMDGVICDFVRAAIKLHNLPIKPKDCDWDFFKPFFLGNIKDFWDKLDFNFWLNLPMHQDGLQLLKWILAKQGSDDVFFCSTPTLSPGCVDGKIAWIKKYFDFMDRRYLITEYKEAAAHSDILLLDDRDSNIERFTKAGGNAVLIPRPWNSKKAETNEEGEFNFVNIQREIARYL